MRITIKNNTDLNQAVALCLVLRAIEFQIDKNPISFSYLGSSYTITPEEVDCIEDTQYLITER